MVTAEEIWLSRNCAAAIMSLVKPEGAELTLESQFRLMTRPEPGVVTMVGAREAAAAPGGGAGELRCPPPARLAMVPRSPTAAVSSTAPGAPATRPAPGLVRVASVCAQSPKSPVPSDCPSPPLFPSPLLFNVCMPNPNVPHNQQRAPDFRDVERTVPLANGPRVNPPISTTG